MAKKVIKTTVKNSVAAAKVSSAAVKKNKTGAAVKTSTAKKSAAVKTAPAAKAKPKKAAAPSKTVSKKIAPAAVKKAAPARKAAPSKTPAAPAEAAPVKTAKKPAAKSITRVRKDEILKKLRLSKADKKFFYGLLMRARSAFGAQVQYHSDDALTRKDAAGERAGMATHMADLGTDNYRRDFELGLLSDGVDVLEMIDEALQRLEDSEYGICLDCGEPIPRKRLEAKPYAKYCTKCKSKREEMDETFYHRR